MICSSWPFFGFYDLFDSFKWTFEYKIRYSNIWWLAWVTLNRTHVIKSSGLDRFTLNFWKTPKCVSLHVVYILQVQDGEYTELLFITRRWLSSYHIGRKRFFFSYIMNQLSNHLIFRKRKKSVYIRWLNKNFKT